MTGPVIAAHHSEDTWRPRQSWPAAVQVQWGENGLVFTPGAPHSYQTAFFEAFPQDGSAGFIRAEGADLEAAELHAYQLWQRQHGCAEGEGGHRWTRSLRLREGRVQTYTNGGCHCLRCGAFEVAMSPIVELGAFNAPLSATELESMASGFCRASPWSVEDRRSRKWRQRMALRGRRAGIALPEVTPREPGREPFDPDGYELACRHAVAEYCRRHLDMLDGGGMDMFSSLSRISLRRLVEDSAGSHPAAD
jgi:hypothetical protein